MSSTAGDALQQAIDRALGAPGARPAAALTDTAGRINQSEVALSVFNKLLVKEGLREALYSLLRRTDYRYIAIFRFRDGKATSAVHVDRLNLMDLQAAEVEDTATYCSFVRDGRQPFATADATLDPRTATHPARDVVRSYCGVPIVASSGELIGTLCHYDLVPRDPAQLDAALLAQATQIIADSGLVPPYPS